MTPTAGDVRLRVGGRSLAEERFTAVCVIRRRGPGIPPASGRRKVGRKGSLDGVTPLSWDIFVLDGEG